MNKTVLGLLVVISIFGLISCENTAGPTGLGISELSDGTLAKKNSGGGSKPACSAVGTSIGFNQAGDNTYDISEYTLWAGQQYDAGTVTITNDDENIYVNFYTNGTADLEEVHVYVWTNPDDIPSKRPAPGQADYFVEDIDADSYTLVIPANIDCGDTYYISTHVALDNEGSNDDDDDCDHDGNDGNDGDCDCDDDDCDHDGNDDDNDSNHNNGGETAYAGDSASPECFGSKRGAWWGYVTYNVDCFYNIAGTVYEDLDNSSDMDVDEIGYSDITVSLNDVFGTTITTTMTNADGSYLFESIPSGYDYSVDIEVGPVGTTATENAAGFVIYDLWGNNTDLDFGFYTPVVNPPDFCEITSHTLWVNSDEVGGNVTVSNSERYLLLEYTASSGSYFDEIRVDVLLEAPGERGDLTLYTYNSLNDKGFEGTPASYVVDIKISSLTNVCDQSFYVLAYALVDGEVAYAGPSSSWATSNIGEWFYYISSGVCCPDPIAQ